MMTKEKLVIAVGKRIRQIRTDKGLSIEKLALLSGLSYSQIIRIENGKINTSIHQLHLIARTLKVYMMDFFEGVD
jgi:transcriptional regulator with XRE-family HTH domain